MSDPEIHASVRDPFIGDRKDTRLPPYDGIPGDSYRTTTRLRPPDQCADSGYRTRHIIRGTLILNGRRWKTTRPDRDDGTESGRPGAAIANPGRITWIRQADEPYEKSKKYKA